MNNKHIYHVTSYNSKDFYIEINLQDKKLYFYNDEHLSHSLGELSLAIDDPFFNIPGIDYESMVLATVQAVKAFRANHFPEYISKQS